MMRFLISILCRVVVIKKLDIDMQESARISQLISPSCSRHFSVRRQTTTCVCFFFFNCLTAIPVQSKLWYLRSWIFLPSSVDVLNPSCKLFRNSRVLFYWYHTKQNKKKKENCLLAHFLVYMYYFQRHRVEIPSKHLPLEWCAAVETQAENRMPSCPSHL